MSKHIAKMAIALCIAVALLLSVTTVAMAVSSQLWYLDSETTTTADYQMEKSGSPGNDGQIGSLAIGASNSRIWIADQAALSDVTFPSGTWVVELETDSDWGTNGNKCAVTIGAWNGTTFSAFTTTNIFKWSSGTLIMDVELQSGSATVDKDHYLALKIENEDGSGHTV